MYYRNGGVYLPVLYAKEIRLQPSQTILASQNYLAQQSEVHTQSIQMGPGMVLKVMV